MSNAGNEVLGQRFRRFAAACCLLATAMWSGTGKSEVIWAGDFETGNFMQWHAPDNRNVAVFWQMPQYGAPVNPGNLASGQTYSVFGDGSLLSIATSPTRQGKYSAKVTVKNSASGTEPADCDTYSSICTLRRTMLTMQLAHSDYYNAIPYQASRWISFSVYLPSDWDFSGSGFGPQFFELKPRNDSGITDAFSIQLENGAWKIWNRWSPLQDPVMDQIPWQQQMFYAGNYAGAPYPRADAWPEGLKDFPDVTASVAALKSVKLGAWTDWVINLRPDARGSDAGGTGFLTVWKREGSGPWVKVLHILPKQTTRGGMTFNHGIMFNSPPHTDNKGGFGVKAGLYMAKEQVWGIAKNRVIYMDNIKVGSADATFVEMSPDGSAPGVTPPQPPSGVIAN